MIKQRLGRLGDLFEQREQVVHPRDLLFAKQDQRLFQHGLHLLSVGDEVRRDVAAVELHAFDHFERGLGGLGFLD